MKKIFLFIGLLLSIQLFAGTITKSITTLSNFGNVYPFHSSTTLRYSVSATSLTADLLITADNGFEISTSYSYGYSKTITLTPVSGTISSTIIFVRFSPSAVGSASGNIVNSSVGSVSQNVAVSGTCFAWAIPTSPNNYYSTASGTGSNLKTNLYNKILGHTAVAYGSGTCSNCIWSAYGTTDIQPNGKIWDIYSTRFDTISPYEYTFSSNQCGSYSVEGDCYNREHSFPKSWFNDASPMYSELFHILASDGKVNGQRNNYPYGNVTSATWTSLYGGKLGTGTTNYGYTGIVFEPIDEYKGDVARGYFYMATRYQNIIAGWISNTGANDVLDGTSFPCFDAWHISLLQEWNNLDPVSDKEMKRNNAIYAIQNNRNPFIDSPQFAQRIWGGNLPANPTIAASNFTITNNSNTSVTLNWKSGNGNRRIVLLKAASAVNTMPTDTFYYAANSNITSATQIGIGNYIVYNGTGSSVTLTNLTQGTNYYYAIVEYNGWYSTSNYQTSSYLTSNATTLPIQLTYFDATLANENIILNWTTASEQNNDYFTIERSLDNQNWKAIGKVKVNGNSSTLKKYLYADNIKDIPSTINSLYYRLQQTDFDGTTTLSKTVIVDIGSIEIQNITISPNPFTNIVRISFQTPLTGQVSYSIKNLIGKTYVESKMELQNGAEQQIELNSLEHLAAGIYVLQLQVAGKQFQYKIIKQ